jgi:hypothetical protein
VATDAVALQAPCRTFDWFRVPQASEEPDSQVFAEGRHVYRIKRVRETTFMSRMRLLFPAVTLATKWYLVVAYLCESGFSALWG